jgi:hypothetical protein
MKRRTFHWRIKARRRRVRHEPEGMQRGTRSGFPLPRLRVLPRTSCIQPYRHVFPYRMTLLETVTPNECVALASREPSVKRPLTDAEMHGQGRNPQRSPVVLSFLDRPHYPATTAGSRQSRPACALESMSARLGQGAEHRRKLPEGAGRINRELIGLDKTAIAPEFAKCNPAL